MSKWTPIVIDYESGKVEGLPEVDGRYLVTLDDGEVLIDSYEVYYGFASFYEDQIKAWMPLPKPYISK